MPDYDDLFDPEDDHDYEEPADYLHLWNDPEDYEEDEYEQDD